jgi:predicted dehydrogenase
MNLPEGVTFSPLQKKLIEKDAPAWIRINTKDYTENAEYEINERSFDKAIIPYLHGDWADFDRLFQIKMGKGSVAYSGSEHSGSPKKPNITIIPNWETKESRGLSSPYTVMGCTMGHCHPKEPSGYRIQEVYEFQSYGIIVIDRENGEPFLWVAKDGDKAAVPNGCHMTIYNLGDESHPLITLDFADPDRNPSDKKEFIKRYGPILLIYYDDFEVTFVLNHLYVNNREHSAGVRLPFTPSEDERRIKISRAGRMDLGRSLYEQLTGNPEVIGKFERLGLRIKKASTQAALEPITGGIGNRLYFSRPLAQEAVPGTELYKVFIRTEGEKSETSEAKTSGDDFVKALERKAEIVRRLIELEKLERPLVILVQGAGEWVERAYRPTFKALVQDGYSISVFYADDTSWKGYRPSWTEKLEPWEVYLDKSDPKDLAIYHNVLSRVDVVFIVTPDFTHSEIAKECVRKRVPTVFVEKPFDSHIENVESLLREMGFLYILRAVLGVDHYMLYAVELKNMMPKIQDHLGGALDRVEFYMTENRPIERERERSLQYGLMLDMLPHMFAMLAYFVLVSTVDDIRIIEAGQYRPLISQDKDGNRYHEDEPSSWYRNETYVRVKFTVEDYSGNRVPCLGVVGKGLSSEVKYMEVIGVNGNAVRIDLVNKEPAPDGYPYDSIFLLANPKNPPDNARKVQDPYNPTRTLYILPAPMARLDRKRYKRLVEDLINGTIEVISNVLLLDEAYEIVRALDRIWWAIQDTKSRWRETEHDLGKLNPVKPDKDC